MTRKSELIKSPEQIVKNLISEYIKEGPRRITLKLDWKKDSSSIDINGDKIKETVPYPLSIDFTSFARGVLDAYKDLYGNLYVVSSGLREEKYENDKVRLKLYPTGGAGIFDIYVEYK